MTAQTTYVGVLDMQVCVPEEFTDAETKDFAEKEHPCGTTAGWTIRRKGDSALGGRPERVKCADRGGHVHIMLDA